MKIIKASEAKVLKFDNHQITEYPTNNREINISIAQFFGGQANCNSNETGEKFSYNEVCQELVYVIEGEGKIVFPDEEISFAAGDVFLIKPQQKYYWSGEFKIVTACTPAWYPAQHKIAE